MKQEFGISTLEKTSDIIYFGSMQSNTFLRVYDKRLEQESKGIACLSDWVRWEIVYRDEKADALIDQLITYNFDLGAVVVGVLSYYLRIAVVNPLDGNRSHWIHCRCGHASLMAWPLSGWQSLNLSGLLTQSRIG